jgi:hypothetical protein
MIFLICFLTSFFCIDMNFIQIYFFPAGTGVAQQHAHTQHLGEQEGVGKAFAQRGRPLHPRALKKAQNLTLFVVQIVQNSLETCSNRQTFPSSWNNKIKIINFSHRIPPLFLGTNLCVIEEKSEDGDEAARHAAAEEAAEEKDEGGREAGGQPHGLQIEVDGVAEALAAEHGREAVAALHLPTRFGLDVQPRARLRVHSERSRNHQLQHQILLFQLGLQ